MNTTFCMMTMVGGSLPVALSAQSVLSTPVATDKMPNVVVIVAET